MKIIIYLTAIVAAAALAVLIYNQVISYCMYRSHKNTERHSGTGIIKGAEPIYLEGTGECAVLLLHGFIGSPTDFGRLPKLLNEAGYTVSVPLLPGHGTDPRDFSKVTSDELISCAHISYNELKKTHKEVVLIGFSMGGALSVVTAVQNQVDRLVLLAPYFNIAHQWYYVLPTEVWHKWFSPLIPYTYRPLHFRQINNKSAIARIIDYDYVSMEGTKAAFEVGAKACRLADRIKAETLIIHSKNDRATDYKTTEKFSRIIPDNKAKLVTVENSNHILMWDYDSEHVESSIMDFLNEKPNRLIERQT